MSHIIIRLDDDELLNKYVVYVPSQGFGIAPKIELAEFSIQGTHKQLHQLADQIKFFVPLPLEEENVSTAA